MERKILSPTSRFVDKFKILNRCFKTQVNFLGSVTSYTATKKEFSLYRLYKK
jgi:hypothetical protein